MNLTRDRIVRAVGAPMARRMSVVLILCFGCHHVVVDASVDPQRLRELKCLAVLPFENHSDYDRAGEITAAIFSNQLLTSGRYSVLEPLEASRILDSLGLGRKAIGDPVQAKRYGEALGVEAIVIGAVSEFKPRGGEFQETRVHFTFRLVDVKSGDVVWASTVSDADTQLLFALPRSRARLGADALASGIDALVSLKDGSLSDREVCWVPYAGPPDQLVLAQTAESANGKAITYVAHGGETLRRLAETFLVNPARLDLLASANPGVREDDIIRRHARIMLPRSIDYTTGPSDSLATIAEQELGHVAYALLLYGANRQQLSAKGADAQDAKYGVLVDARQRWSLFEVLGSVDDLFVVVNGVPRLFPRVTARLRWLLYGRKLPMAGDHPADEVFFEITSELTESVAKWRLEIKDPKGAVVRKFQAEGPPPPRVDWDGTLDTGRLKLKSVYSYQIRLTYPDGSSVASPSEAFGVATRAEAPQLKPRAIIRDRDMKVVGGRFRGRFSTQDVVGELIVEFVSESGSEGYGKFLVPSVDIVRPTKLEMLEVGVGNEIYNFPEVPIVDGKMDLKALDRVDITFSLTGRTEPGNTIVLDGNPLEVAANGEFGTTLHLRRGPNLYSILARSPQGSQTFLEEQIFMRTRGAGDDPWEYSPSEWRAQSVGAKERLSPGMELKIPLLRVPLGSQTTIGEALFTPDAPEEAEDATEPDGSDAPSNGP